MTRFRMSKKELSNRLKQGIKTEEKIAKVNYSIVNRRRARKRVDRLKRILNEVRYL